MKQFYISVYLGTEVV